MEKIDIIQNVIVDWLKSDNENATYCAHLILEAINPKPSEHPQEAEADKAKLESILKKHVEGMDVFNGKLAAFNFLANIKIAMTEFADLKSKEARNKALQEAIEATKGTNEDSFISAYAFKRNLLYSLEKLKQ